MEDKQKILDLLLPALQAIWNLADLKSLEYDKEKDMVIAGFAGGGKKSVDVGLDSGTSMIRDVLKHIV